jgi:hypothetical protein
MIMQLIQFFGKCVRFILYAFLWILLLIDFRSQSAAVAQTSNATNFVRHLLPIVLEIAGLVVLPLAFIFARSESRTQRVWAAIGIVLALVIIFVPVASRYLLSLVHLAAWYKTFCIFSFCPK